MKQRNRLSVSVQYSTEVNLSPAVVPDFPENPEVNSQFIFILPVSAEFLLV